LAPYARLCAGGREGQRLQQTPDERRFCVSEAPARIALDLPPEQAQAQLMSEKLLERQPTLCGMTAVRQQLEVGVRRRAMDVFERLTQRRPARFFENLARQQLTHGASLGFLQRRGRKLAQTPLLHPFRERINRRERLGGR